MASEEKNGWSTARSYRLRVPIYDNEEGVKLLREIARQRGCSMAAAVRQMVREEASRKGLTGPPDDAAPPKAEPYMTDRQRPFWERAAEIVRSIPSEERRRFPPDGAEQHDHYVYGVPRRDAEGA